MRQDLRISQWPSGARAVAYRSLARMAVRVVGREAAVLTPLLTVLGLGVPARRTALVRARERFSLEVSLRDGYWMSFALRGSYEPEIAGVLARLPARPTLFVDGGANIGYWSLVAETTLAWTAIAIEASPHLVASLERNRQINGATFEIRAEALWDEDGCELTFRSSEAAHAGGHLASVEGFVAGWRLERENAVTTTTVDTVVAGRTATDGDRVVIKLDVEGAEARAMRGARRTIDAGAILIYEDHGADLDSALTASLPDAMEAYVAGPGGLERVASAHDLRARKLADRSAGLNIFAVKRGSRCADELARLAAP